MLKFLKNKAFEKTHQIQIDEAMLHKKNINQFFKESNCHQIIMKYGNQKTRKLQGDLKKTEKAITDLEGQIQNKQGEKDRRINEIMTLSFEVNTEDKETSRKALEKAKKDIERLKEDTEALQAALEEKHLQSKALEKTLYKTMAEVSYTRFLLEQQKLTKVEGNIGNLRKKLNGLRAEKEGIEEKLTELYHMLHGVLGHQQMEQMDLAFLKEASEKEKKESGDD